MHILGQTNFVYVLSHCIVLACGKAKVVKGAEVPERKPPPGLERSHATYVASLVDVTGSQDE